MENLNVGRGGALLEFMKAGTTTTLAIAYESLIRSARDGITGNDIITRFDRIALVVLIVGGLVVGGLNLVATVVRQFGRIGDSRPSSEKFVVVQMQVQVG